MLAETAAERVRRKIAQLRAKQTAQSRLTRDLAAACHALGTSAPRESVSEAPERR